ncbi:MAG: DNA gyrase inhibitor YacG [Oligoflexales bacterium]|nr:DNA gyrase inhibitor YacG [Oligoflexales bacterium]
MKKNTEKKIIKCPACKKLIEYSEKNEWRPFCSNRCKTIDIAAWANEEYRVPVKSLELRENDEIDDTDDIYKDQS